MSGLFIPNRRDKDAYKAKAKAHAAAQASPVDGQALKGDQLATTSEQKATKEVRKITPIMKPNRMPQRPPSPKKDVDELLKPKGMFANTAVDLGAMDPKSPEWGKKLDLDALRSESIVIPRSELNQLQSVQSKPRYHPVTGTSSAPTYTSDADEKSKRLAKILDELEPEKIDIDKDFKVEGLVPSLLEHQIYGVQFLISREKASEYKSQGKNDVESKIKEAVAVSGGFLCDEMGLGKTVQSLALILKNKPDAKKDGPKTTLVVAPLSLMAQWIEEAQSKAPSLKIKAHYGKTRATSADEFANYDVIVTTYDMVSREHHKGALFQHTWYRIIADEAHTFRNPTTALSEAVAALKSDGRRWALTGTPLHNSVNDIFSLVRFIGAKPYSDNEVWKRDVSSLMGRSNRSQEALQVVSTIMKTLMLRRRQDTIASILPPIHRRKVPVTLTESESKIYKGILKHNKDQGKDALRVVLMTRMRQACDDINILPEELRSETPVISEKDKADEDMDALSQSVKSLSVGSQEVASKDGEDSDLNDLISSVGSMTINSEESTIKMSSKTKAVIEVIEKDLKRKVVVFSSYTSMLVLIAKALHHKGIKSSIYDGSLTAAKRMLILKSFKDDEETVVLLCSLQTASIGLNITWASRVIMVEPWWNPMIVDQAVKRVHRLGQTRSVDVYEMMVVDSLEERTFEVQDRKRKLADSILEKKEKLGKKEMDYLLFGGEPPAPGS